MNEKNLLGVFGDQIRRFVKMESFGGMLLLAATVAAMVVKNSPVADWYLAFLSIEGEVRVGAISVQKPLFLWTNDGLMAVFFFLIGLEIKHEFLHGHLANRAQLILPTAGAVGGVAVPALIYIAFNSSDPAALKGWAVPTATDIAFALGVLAVLGSRLPASLKIFLMTLAILDDLIAIVIIALFYTSGLSTSSLAAAAVCVVVLFILNRARVTAVVPYLIVGTALWVCVLKSGVHATLAGVVTAMFIPQREKSGDSESVSDWFVDELHPWVAFAILPLFAFVNAGISFDGLSFARLLDPVPLGISLGLMIGKPVGVLAMVALVVGTGLTTLPDGTSWRQMIGIGVLCGIGFTMSLFIGGLAFAEGGAGYARIDRLGILVGSGVSAIAGYLMLRASAARP